MRIGYIATLVAACGVTVLESAAGDITEAARGIQQEEKEAVVWVEGILNMEISAQGQTQTREQEVETLGTVIDEKGLTVVPSSALNPTGMLTRMMRGSGMSMDGQLSDVELRLADGTEIEAKVILKDDDLDIAFIAPVKPFEKEEPPEFEYIDMDDSATPQLLEQIVILGRMPKSMNRQAAVSLSRVTSIVDKPRTFYSLDNLTSMGTPAFTKDGKPIGISVLKRGRNLDPSDQNSNITPVILPAEDILDIAEQAKSELAKSD